MDSPTIHASCPKSGVFQKYNATGKATIVTQKACENTTESGGSVLVITFTNNLVTAKHSAEKIAAETPGGMPFKVGRMITNAPIKPATNAPHLQGSDFSPKKIIAPNTANMGVVKPTAVFKSKGILGKAQNQPNNASVKNIPLTQCKPGLFIFMPMLPVRKTQGERQTTIINARMKVKKNGCKS